MKETKARLVFGWNIMLRKVVRKLTIDNHFKNFCYHGDHRYRRTIVNSCHLFPIVSWLGYRTKGLGELLHDSLCNPSGSYARCTRSARYEIINLDPFWMKQEFIQISRESVVNILWTTKTNCRVGSIDFYLIFPTSFSILTLPLTPDCPYTVIIHIRFVSLILSLSLGQLCVIRACFVFIYSKGPP